MDGKIMAKYRVTCLLLTSLASLLVQGCSHKKGDVWDQNKTAAHFNGKGGYWGSDELSNSSEGAFGVNNEEFVSLNEEDLKAQFGDEAFPQSSKTPGEPGSGIPGIEHFQNPSAILSSIFRNLLFNTNEHTLRSQDSLNLVCRLLLEKKE